MQRQSWTVGARGTAVWYNDHAYEVSIVFLRLFPIKGEVVSYQEQIPSYRYIFPESFAG